MQSKKVILVKKLKLHYQLEFLNAFGLPFLFILNSFVHNQAIGINSLAAIFLNGILLFEGSYLWFSIYRNLTQKQDDSFIRFFRIIRPVNLLLIILTATLIAYHPFKSTFEKFGALSFLVLAILEHINYFEVQLMYNSKNDLQYLRLYKRFKKAKLNVLMTNSKVKNMASTIL